MSTYWPGVEGELAGLASLQHEPADVVGELLDRLDPAVAVDDRHAAAQHLLVVVDELDLEVGERVRAGTAASSPPASSKSGSANVE